MRIERGSDPGPFTNSRYKQRYKPYLRSLFRHRCAYCLRPDDRLGGQEAMTVEHFKPEKWHPRLRLVWSNLYYACAVCNMYYKKDHPTPSEEAEGKRLVDPCAENPDDHFRLVADPESGRLCRVRPLSPAAEYSVFRLKLNRRKCLRDYWRELDDNERKLLVRECQILQRIQDCENLIDRHGSNHELEQLTTDYNHQLMEARSLLKSTRRLRPFPAERN